MTAAPPLHLYVHIPFCRRKCRYCDFYSVPYDEGVARRYVDALAAEWRMVADLNDLSLRPITTLYIGGGTPSALPPALWEQLGRKFLHSLPRTPDCEWTVECNPDSFSGHLARTWIDLGVTRLSIGVQSLDDGELRIAGRLHTARRAEEVLDSPPIARFRSVGADVIYGLPGQTRRNLDRTLSRILSRPVVKHLSAYELTMHEETSFSRHRRLLPLPGDDAVADMTTQVRDACAQHGLQQYEVSNYALPGRRSRHNLAYWDHAPYVGLGAAAHSYLPPTRRANVSSLPGYLAAIEQGRQPVEFSEALDDAALAREMIFLRLRTSDGLDERIFADRTGGPFASGQRAAALDDLVASGLILLRDGVWTLTAQGMLVGDEVARRLM